jgi:hypothetical protein
VCMWDRDGMEMLSALRRAREALRAIDPASEAGMRYRTRQELEGLFGEGFDDDVTAELIAVEADYTGFDEFWEALRGGANQSGQWAATLTGNALDEAQAEVSRQLGEPSGPFTLRAAAWAVRATVPL